MAKQVVAFELRADGNQAEGSVKSLKAQLREAQADVQKLSDKFGATSKEAIQAAKRAAELKDAIGDAKALTDAFNPDAKFKAFGAALQGVAGGFAALQGAQALFGSQSEELEKTLLKVQGAMALSQGLNALGEAGDAFKTLGKQAVDAFNKIKVAIGSSGIGLLVIALGVIVAYWDDIKEAVSGVSDEQKKLLETQKKSVAAAEKSLDSISKSENILKLQGKSEKDILNLKIAATKQTITQLEAQLTTQKTMRQAQIDAAKRNKEILEGVLKFLSLPLTAILKTVDTIGKIAGKDFGLEDKFFGGIAKMVFDPEEVATEADKTIEETQNKLTELKNSQAGFQLQIQQINKDAANKAAETQKKADADAEALRKQREADEKARLDNLAAQNKHTDELIEQNRLSAIKDGFTKRQMELAGQEQKEIDAELERLNNKLITQEQYEINRSNIVQKYANLQTELVATEEQKRLDLANKQREEDLKNAEATAQAKIQLAQAVGNALGELSNLIGAQTAVGKGLALAQIAIDTGLAISALTKNSEANPTNAVTGGIAGAIQFATGLARIIANIAKAKQILSQANVPAKGGGGGNIPTSATAPLSPQLQVQQTQLNQSQINQLASATSRAFVLESDVSGSQERIRRINRAARIN